MKADFPSCRIAFALGLPSVIRLFRGVLLDEVSNGDLRRIVRKLIESAAAGDVQAAKTILDRIMGPCVSFDLLEKIEELEAVLQKLES